MSDDISQANPHEASAADNEPRFDSKTIESKTIDAKLVARYLEENPEFFLKHADLLDSLELKHDSGQAVSLIEHQLARLRDKNETLEIKLKTLINNARENDRLYSLTRRAINAFLETQDLGDLVDAVHYQFAKEFKVEYTRFLFFSEPQATGKAQYVSGDSAKRILGDYFKSAKPACGSFTPEIRQFIFTEDAAEIGSMALAFIKPGGKARAILAIGNREADFYKSGSETMFLSHICDVLERQIHNVPEACLD